jgi:hypothetical protein
VATDGSLRRLTHEGSPGCQRRPNFSTVADTGAALPVVALTAATHRTGLSWTAEALKPRIPSLCNQAELTSPYSDDVLRALLTLRCC